MRRPAAQWLRAGLFTLVGTLSLLASGCHFGEEFGWIDLEARQWYTSFAITMEIRTGGSRYARVLYEYNRGDGWELGFERTLNFARSGEGILEFTAEPGYTEDPLVAAEAQNWDHRITASALVSPAPGRPLEPGATVERYFRIDTIAPSAGADLSIVHLPDIPSVDDFSADIDHTGFHTPSGSRVEVLVAPEWADFEDRNEQYGNSARITVWQGNPSPHSETWKFMVVDEAGNRSGIRRVTFSY